MNTPIFTFRKNLIFTGGVCLLTGLYLTSHYSYLLFHTAAEMVTIIVGVSLFIIAWNSRHILDNNYLLMLGISWLFVSCVDFLHTLAYKGMGIFKGYDANLPTQLWIVARYLQSLSLLIAPLFIRRKVKTDVIFLLWFLVTTGLLLAVFKGVFPVCFIEGSGLTLFKKISEYMICLILFISAGLLIREREGLDQSVFYLILIAVFLTIGAEIAFTVYVSVYGLSNVVGHLFKLMAFYSIYLAMIKTALEKPYNLLFRNLKQSEGALQEERDQLELIVGAHTSALRMANERLKEELKERDKNEKQIKKHLERLSSLRAIDIAIASSLNMTLSLNVVLDHVLTQLNADATSVLIINRNTHYFEYAAGRGFRTSGMKQIRLRPIDDITAQAVFSQTMIHIPDLATEIKGTMRFNLLKGEGFVDYHAAPLIAKGQVLGILEVYMRAPFVPDLEWSDYLVMLAGQAAIAIDSITLFNDLQRSNNELILAYDATIDGWSKALDLRDKETEGHSQRVTDMTLRLAQEMGISDADQVHIRRGALLHDIGKMGIPDNILFKQDELTPEERETMRKHPEFAYEMLSPIHYLRSALEIPYCHHEKWDGTGYPRGLKGEQIPLAARLFTVADVWDALCSDRPYRTSWTPEKTFEYIKSLSGSHFDPDAVECLSRIMKGL